MTIKTLNHDLAAGLSAMKIELAESSQDKLLNYCDQMLKWNKVYNLTAITNPKEMLSKHVFDSLSLLPILQGERIIDVGTGAGLPGIPLAIAKPEIEFTLLDRSLKKTRFLKQMQAELKLSNLKVVQSRIEDYQSPKPFDMVLSRAFLKVGDIVESCSHLCQDGGKILLMKGQYPQAELADCPNGYQVQQVEALSIPNLPAKRHLVLLTKENGT